MRFVKALFAIAFLWAGAAGAQILPGVRVEVAPPPPIVEARPMRPAPNYIWVTGHWSWRYGRHVWLHGHWALPPGPGYRWVEARWVREGPAWRFFAGHWMPPAQPVYMERPAGPEVVATEAPPAEIVETPPPMPRPGYLWIKGYWRWEGGQHIWVAGYWAPPRVGYRWVNNHWENRGGRWVFVHGGWVR